MVMRAEMMFRILYLALAIFCLTSISEAKVKLSLSGLFQTDIRFRLNDISVGKWYEKREAKPGVSRNDNLFRLKLVAQSDRYTGVAEVDFAYYGFSNQLDGFDDIYRQEVIDAFRIEANAAYIDIPNLFIEGLDLRVGQQIIAWGVGDQFNPTNVINAPDLEDPLRFGDQLANVMVKLDYSPFEDFTFSGVMIPIFRPALLPRTAPLGIAFAERLPFTDDALRYRIHSENWFIGENGYPTVVDQAIVVLPDFQLNNIQWAARLATTLGDHDLAFLFYYGRSAMPQYFASVAQAIDAPQCNPVNPSDCIDGKISTTIGLYFPRHYMLGFNAAGELPNPLKLLSKKIKNFGYRLELGLYFPEAVSNAILQKNLRFDSMPDQPDGEYLYSSGQRPYTIEDKVFAKWTLGIDYTFSSKYYLNMQWVHGLVDEYGGGFFGGPKAIRAGGVDTTHDLSASTRCALKVLQQNAGESVDFSDCAYEITKPRINDYFVIGLDMRFLDHKGLFRLFMIFDLIGVYEERWDSQKQERVEIHHGLFSEKGFSMVVFPELSYNFGSGLELSMGALLQFGKEYSKFGDPAAGGHQLWTRAKFAY